MKRETQAKVFLVAMLTMMALAFLLSGLYFGVSLFMWNEQRQGNEIHITGQDYCCLPCNQTTDPVANLSDQANPGLMPRR